MKPIRKIRKLNIIQNAWGFPGRVCQQEDVEHSLTESGEVISNHVEQEIALDCGCLNTAPGGICIECVAEGARGIVCTACFNHCLLCRRPTCTGHSGFVHFSDGQEFRYCRQCYKTVTRQLHINKILSLFTLP